MSITFLEVNKCSTQTQFKDISQDHRIFIYYQFILKFLSYSYNASHIKNRLKLTRLKLLFRTRPYFRSLHHFVPFIGRSHTPRTPVCDPAYFPVFHDNCTQSFSCSHIDDRVFADRFEKSLSGQMLWVCKLNMFSPKRIVIFTVFVARGSRPGPGPSCRTDGRTGKDYSDY